MSKWSVESVTGCSKDNLGGSSVISGTKFSNLYFSVFFNFKNFFFEIADKDRQGYWF
jgi:hypothetical protein